MRLCTLLIDSLRRGNITVFSLRLLPERVPPLALLDLRGETGGLSSSDSWRCLWRMSMSTSRCSSIDLFPLEAAGEDRREIIATDY